MLARLETTWEKPRPCSLNKNSTIKNQEKYFSYNLENVVYHSDRDHPAGCGLDSYNNKGYKKQAILK